MSEHGAISDDVDAIARVRAAELLAVMRDIQRGGLAFIAADEQEATLAGSAPEPAAPALLVDANAGGSLLASIP